MASCQSPGATQAAPSAGATPAGTPDSAHSTGARAGFPYPADTSAPRRSASPQATQGTCTKSALNATAYQADRRPTGAGTGAAILKFTNTSRHTCVIQGHLSIAGAREGSRRPEPLSVTHQGSAAPVRLAPGGSAWVKLTFVQVQGEAGGYCASGSKPSAYPALIVGVPNSGSHHVALSDGQFAECDNRVTVTAVSETKPS
ncbi:DUF4232 domain-containing protein [Streptomyces chartreusis]